MEETPQTPGGTPPGETPHPHPSGVPEPSSPVHTPHAAEMPEHTDAMGLDKYRKVVGKTYGPTRQRQIRVFATFFACLGLALLGGKLLADQLDKPPDSNPAVAPWSAPDAPKRAVTIPTEPESASQP
jgi:hypothetical protein